MFCKNLQRLNNAQRIDFEKQLKGTMDREIRPLQDQDSSFSAQENEVKSNLIAITEDNSDDTKKL